MLLTNRYRPLSKTKRLYFRTLMLGLVCVFLCVVVLCKTAFIVFDEYHIWGVCLDIFAKYWFGRIFFQLVFTLHLETWNFKSAFIYNNLIFVILTHVQHLYVKNTNFSQSQNLTLLIFFPGYPRNPFNDVVCNDTISASGVFTAKELCRLSKGMNSSYLYNFIYFLTIFCLTN